MAAVGVGFSFCLAAALDGQYGIDRLNDGRTSVLRGLKAFNVVFMAFVCILFLTHGTDIYSRATLVLQYGAITLTLVVVRVALVRQIRRAIAEGRIEVERVALIGLPGAIDKLAASLARGGGVAVAATWALPAWVTEPLSDSRRSELELIAADLCASLRSRELDDIVIVLPWGASSSVQILARCVAALPATLNLLPDDGLFGTAAPAVKRVGRETVVSLQSAPLTALEQVGKRVFDIAVASIALAVAAPLLALAAVAIRLDSPGPVIFRQQRYGFNQKPFQITKFRTMTTMEDGPVIRQARPNDPRVTTIGRLLRRSNIDELPQLFDVLRGDMSLVGPRPHAVAHDRLYETRIASYARRHKVKPGLTGWAQVNGYRGETSSDEQMRKRVEHDLYYIDCWSFAFDVQILFMTVLSRKAYKNAF